MSGDIFSKGSSMSSQRTRKVQSLLVREVAEILQRDIKDPRVEGVTITEARVSPDLKNATLFYQSHSEGSDLEAIATGLDSVRGVVKRIFGKRVRLKFCPDIHFRYDSSLEYAEHIENLLKEIGTSSEEREND